MSGLEEAETPLVPLAEPLPPPVDDAPFEDVADGALLDFALLVTLGEDDTAADIRPLAFSLSRESNYGVQGVPRKDRAAIQMRR